MKWFILGLLMLVLTFLLGLRSLTRPELTLAPGASKAVSPLPGLSLSVTGLQIGELMLDGSDGHVSGPLVVAGLALPGAVVQIRRDETFLGEVTVDASGDWSFRDVVRLLPGRYRFEVRLLGANQAVIKQSERIVVVIPKIAIELPPPISPVKIAQPLPVIAGVNKDQGGNLSKGFFGRGRPNSTIEIVQGRTVLGTIRVQADGSWRCACVLPPGVHTLAVREVRNPKRMSSPLVVTIANPAPPMVLPERQPEPARPRATCPDPLPAGEIRGHLYAIAECETLGRIAFRLHTDLPTLLAYNPQIPNPNRIYAGQLLNIPAPASCSALN
ncbi:LysM peptidoglycan-binding domain-containing protein [Candidatus Entotheonella palauensis]|uniref:LysM peptidoglycan-binding domain-containing protein n=1 Tax=Candidatus Entotheonella palauensis TaxID=93172 RepID=UPI0015C4815B|nr:LysM peptidoglycan-binding domain-containing protein [Candidatus Entotheonella palauensis]